MRLGQLKGLGAAGGGLRAGWVALGVAACATEDSADVYRRALAAPGWEEGRALCVTLPEAMVGECLVGVMEAHDRTAREDCDGVPEGLWRDECVFLYAERAARAGDAEAAIAACSGTRFARECSYHLVRNAARAVLDRPMDEAAQAIAPWRSLAHAPDAPRLFWRAYFRERLGDDVPVDVSGCPDEACLDGGREAIFMTLNALAHVEGFCERVPDGLIGERRVWIDDAVTRGWVEKWSARDCVRRRDPPAKPPTP